MTTTISPSLYHKKSSVLADQWHTVRHWSLSVSASMTLTEHSSKQKQMSWESKKSHSTAGVHSMSLANYDAAELEKSSLLTLDRLTAVRRCGRVLDNEMRAEVERLWLAAHMTEFFNSTDVVLVERAEGIINGFRFAASQAAGSR